MKSLCKLRAGRQTKALENWWFEAGAPRSWCCLVSEAQRTSLVRGRGHAAEVCALNLSIWSQPSAGPRRVDAVDGLINSLWAVEHKSCRSSDGMVAVGLAMLADCYDEFLPPKTQKWKMNGRTPALTTTDPAEMHVTSLALSFVLYIWLFFCFFWFYNTGCCVFWLRSHILSHTSCIVGGFPPLVQCSEFI